MSRRRRQAERGPVLRFRAKARCKRCDQWVGPWHIGLNDHDPFAAALKDAHRHGHPHTDIEIVAGWQSRCRRCLHWRSSIHRLRETATAELGKHERSQEHHDYVPPLAERQEAERRAIADRIVRGLEEQK